LVSLETREIHASRVSYRHQIELEITEIIVKINDLRGSAILLARRQGRSIFNCDPFPQYVKEQHPYIPHYHVLTRMQGTLFSFFLLGRDSFSKLWENDTQIALTGQVINLQTMDLYHVFVKCVEAPVADNS